MVDERGKNIRLHMPAGERPDLPDRRREFLIPFLQIIQLFLGI